MASIKEFALRKNRSTEVFSYLMRYGTSSRKKIADYLSVTGATLTKVSKELLQAGLIYEKGSSRSTTVGRKELDIDIVDTCCYALGFDVASRYLRVSLLNARLELIAMREWNYMRLNEEVLEEGICYLQQLISEYSRDKILGLGLLGQGYVYQEQFMSLPIRNVCQILRQRLNIDIYCMNNIRALTVTQAFFDEKNDNFLMLHYGPGICTVMVQNGIVVSGAHDKAGEIGHTIWELNSDQSCSVCGKRGCVESLLNFERVAKQADPLHDAIYTDYQLLMKACKKDEGRALDHAFIQLAKIVNLLLGFYDPQNLLLCGEIFTNPVLYQRFSHLLTEFCPDFSTDWISLVENYTEKRWKSAGIVVMNEYFGKR